MKSKCYIFKSKDFINAMHSIFGKYHLDLLILFRDFINHEIENCKEGNTIELLIENYGEKTLYIRGVYKDGELKH